MSEFEAMKQRVARSLSDLAETHRKMCDEIQRGLFISTSMIEDLGIAIEKPSGLPAASPRMTIDPVLAEAA
jgi:hypothetical protein